MLFKKLKQFSKYLGYFLYQNLDYFLYQNLGYFFIKICCQELLKVAQSDRAANVQDSFSLAFIFKDQTKIFKYLNIRFLLNHHILNTKRLNLLLTLTNEFNLQL